MLVLTRKKNESIVIDNKIRIQIIDINGGKIRLGIDAPKDVRIFRDEIYEEILKQNLKASNNTAQDLMKINEKLTSEGS